MHIRVDREAFAGYFQAAASVAPSRSPKPILERVKLSAGDNHLLLQATDMEVGIRLEVADVEVLNAGDAVLPVSQLTTILRESSDEHLSIEAGNEGATVRGSRSVFQLPAPPPEEFPNVVGFEEKKFHSISARLMKELIRRTLFATDNESSRYALGGVLLEFEEDKVIAVATDGRRLAKMEAPAEAVGGHLTGEATTIVPTRAMQLIERVLTDPEAEIQVAARVNDLLIRTPVASLYTQLVEGRFPRWREVFPQRSRPIDVQVPVGPFHSALRQAAVATSKESRGLDFTFGDGSLVIEGLAAEVGQSRVEIPIDYTGELVTVRMDQRYVADFLKVLDPEKMVKLELQDEESPAVLSTDDGYAYVVMPLARK